MLHIKNLIEPKRLNGYRKSSHGYLVGKKVSFQCCKLPIQLPDFYLPTQGLLSTPLNLLEQLFKEDTVGTIKPCLENRCPVYGYCSSLGDSGGLMWINEKEYSHAAFWFGEVRTMPVQLDAFGIQNPKQLVNKFILLAHRKAIVDYSQGAFGWVDSETSQAHTSIRYFPGIFAIFQVTALEYVIGDRKPDAKMKKHYAEKQAQGFNLVNIVPEEEIEKMGYAETVQNLE